MYQYIFYRTIVVSTHRRDRTAAYCLQQRYLVRPGVVFANSASHPSERWHWGCLAKPWIQLFNCIIAPVCVRWHRGVQKNTRNIKKKNVRTRCHLTHDYGTLSSYLTQVDRKNADGNFLQLGPWTSGKQLWMYLERKRQVMLRRARPISNIFGAKYHANVLKSTFSTDCKSNCIRIRLSEIFATTRIPTKKRKRISKLESESKSSQN